MELKSISIRNANKAVLRAQKKRALAIFNAISECRHIEVGQCDYLSSKTTFGTAYPPARVCMNCGLMETGWGCGYQVLTIRLVIPISHDDANSLRTVLINEKDRGPLLRHEISVSNLVKQKLGLTEEAPRKKDGRNAPIRNAIESRTSRKSKAEQALFQRLDQLPAAQDVHPAQWNGLKAEMHAGQPSRDAGCRVGVITQCNRCLDDGLVGALLTRMIGGPQTVDDVARTFRWQILFGQHLRQRLFELLRGVRIDFRKPIRGTVPSVLHCSALQQGACYQHIQCAARLRLGMPVGDQGLPMGELDQLGVFPAVP